MKNAKILTGIASASITAALSFALLACGDDSSSSTAPEQDSALLVKDSNLECIHENAEASEAVDALRPVATIYKSDEDGFAYVDMGYVSEIPCGSRYENLKAVVSGDTLVVSGEYIDSYADCLCPTKVSFKVQNNSSFEKVSWISFSDRGTLPLVKENGVGEESSSSEEQGPFSNEEESSSSVSSSSSFDVHMSSMTCCLDLSSSSQGEKTMQRIDDIFGLCLDKKVDPMLDAALPPVAYLGYEDGDDSATVVVENVSMSCRSISGTKSIIRQPIVGNIYLSASGDTLYMQQAALDTVNAEPDCMCDSRLIFKVKADPAFINATILVAVKGGDYGYRMEIVKAFPPDEQEPRDTIPAAQDSVPESNQTELELKGFERGKCMNDDLAAKPVAKSAATERLEARQITYMNGETVLTLENVTDYCGIDAKVSQKMVGDTLMLDYYDATSVTKCICNFDKIEFLIEPENATARYVKFKDVLYWVNEIRYVVDPNWKG